MYRNRLFLRFRFHISPSFKKLNIIAVIAVEFHDELVSHYVSLFLMSALMRCVVNYLPRL